MGRRPILNRSGRLVALVTGASRGFGRATALRLAERADIVIVYREDTDAANEVASLARHAGARALAIQADISEPEAVRSLFQSATACFERVDILVNNAGAMELGAFAQQSSSTWDSMVRVNIVGMLNITHTLLPSMCGTTGGRIVNISSQLAHTGAEEFAVYSGTKAFTLAFTKSLAREVGSYGVTVNAVCPGSIVTDMNRRIYDSQDARDCKANQLPLRRLGVPEDVASAVSFFASDEAAFITGQCLDVNGGNSMP